MTTVSPVSPSVTILFDPCDIHITLDEDRYYFFRRCTLFNDIRNLIDNGQYEHIDLHVPTTFTFDNMRQNPEVYIHTYFVDHEEVSVLNVTEREKIRDSIRLCCENVGVTFLERGVMDSNSPMFEETIDLSEQLVQMDRDHMHRLYP